MSLLDDYKDVPKTLLFDYDEKNLTAKLLFAIAEAKNCQSFIADIDELFHPKLYILDTPESVHAIIGSNNATLGGLENNIELAIHYELDRTQDVKLIGDLNDLWARMHSIANVPLTQALIESRKDDLAQELPRGKSNRHAKKIKTTGVALKLDSPTPTKPRVLPVLFAEIPRGSSRWQQANFDLRTYVDYFHADEGRRLSLLNVDLQGAIGETETRPGVAVKSRNFRIELAAAAMQKYPSNGRPIGIFVNYAPDHFLYMLLLPEDGGYGEAAAILNAHAPPTNGMKRVVVDGSVAQKEWPGCPLWGALPQV